MGKNNPKAACIFGADYLLKQVNSLENDLEGALIGEDIEFVHRMRVASRRLRNGFIIFAECLPPKKGKVWQDNIRQITHNLGTARDLDIQIELLNRLYENLQNENYKPGYTRLLLRLKQARGKAQQKVNQMILEMQEEGLLLKIQNRLEKMTARVGDTYLFTPSLYQRAYQKIDGALADFLSYQDAIQSPENIQKLHAMRIAGKQLRYTLEIFAPIYNQALNPHLQVMRDVQDQLGEIHDDDVWIGWLPRFIDKERSRIENYFGNTGPLNRLLPGFNNLIEDRIKTRAKKYQSFLITWETLQNEHIWEDLKEIINAPINVESALEHLAAARNHAEVEPDQRGGGETKAQKPPQDSDYLEESDVKITDPQSIEDSDLNE